MPSQPPVEVFLDSSIHVSRKKGKDFSTRISQVLNQHSWVGTCAYTKLEYGNVVLSQAQYYLRLLEELGTLSRLLDWVANVTTKAGAKTWAFNLVVQHFGSNEEESTERSKLALKHVMKAGLGVVDATVDKVHDSIECYWVRKGVQLRRQGKLWWEAPNCKKSNLRCKIDHFFVTNKKSFLQIAEEVERLPEDKRTGQLTGFANLIREANVNPTILGDYKNCKAMADALISVESKGYRSLFTQNIRESEVLCKIMHQLLYYLPPSYERGVEQYDFR